METLFDAGILMLCVGALVLVALVAFVFRALARPGVPPADPLTRDPVTGEPITRDPVTSSAIDPLDPVAQRNIPDAEPYGTVPATGARDFDTEVAHQDRVDEDVTLSDPGLDRDRPPYDRDAGDIDDEAYRTRRRDDDEVL